MQIDGTGADGASAGQRDASAATAGYEGSQDERGGSHSLDQFIGRFGSGERARANGRAVLGASVAEFYFGAHCGEELARGLDVAYFTKLSGFTVTLYTCKTSPVKLSLPRSNRSAKSPLASIPALRPWTNSRFVRRAPA